MVLELIDGRPLWEHYAAAGDANFLVDSAAPMGAALGALRRLFRQAAGRKPQPRTLRRAGVIELLLYAGDFLDQPGLREEAIDAWRAALRSRRSPGRHREVACLANDRRGD